MGFEWDKVRMLQGGVAARELGERLSGSHLRDYLDHATTIERSAEEMEARRVAGELKTIEPYWDPLLKECSATRLKFFGGFVSWVAVPFVERSAARWECFGSKRRTACKCWC